MSDRQTSIMWGVTDQQNVAYFQIIMSNSVNQQPRNQPTLSSLPCCSCLQASIIANPFCSTQWLTHSTIPEGAKSFSYTTVCLMTSPHHFPAELFWGVAVGSFPQNHTPFPLKQNNTISHKLWGLIALNHMRSVWLYHAAQANISVLEIQSANAIIKRERERESDDEDRLPSSFSPTKSSGAIKWFSLRLDMIWVMHHISRVLQSHLPHQRKNQDEVLFSISTTVWDRTSWSCP